MSSDNVTMFIGGTTATPTCNCVSTIDDCIFGGACSQISATLTSVCVCTPHPGCPYIAASVTTQLTLTYNAGLSTSDVAIWQYTSGGQTSTVTYTKSEGLGSVQCGWSAAFASLHIPIVACGLDCVTYVPGSFCEFYHPPGSACLLPSGTQQIAFPKGEWSEAEIIAEITEGCDPSCILTWQAADISLFTECKNTNLRCSGFLGYSGICLSNPQ